MQHEVTSYEDIGRALLGLEPGQDTIDSDTLFSRTISAFEATREPMEAVDLLIAAISCMSAQDLDSTQCSKFRDMAASLTAIWTRKTCAIG